MAGMRAVLLFAIWVGAGVFSTDIRANGSVHGSLFAQGTSLGLEGATINLASGCVLGGGYCTYSVNATSATVLAIIALSASGAIFLILELNHPFSGLMQISSAPIRDALGVLGSGP